MKIKINRETCIGCGVCVALAPDYFQLDDEGKSVPKKEEVEEKDIETVRTAAQSCPTGSITLE